MMMRLTCMLFALCLWGISFSQKGISNEVNRFLKEGRFFNEVSLLKFNTSDVHHRTLHLDGLQQGTIITIDQEKIHDLINGQNDLIQLHIPVSDRAEMKLSLIRHDIFSVLPTSKLVYPVGSCLIYGAIVGMATYRRTAPTDSLHAEEGLEPESLTAPHGDKLRGAVV